jgi:Acetyltransferase (GNAT) domain
MADSYFSPYFWQKTAFAEFWKTANGTGHGILQIEKEYFGIKIKAIIYQYPWFLGQKFWYLPEGPVVQNLYFNPQNENNSRLHHQTSSKKDLQDEASRIRSALQLFFQAVLELGKKERVAFIKYDADDALATKFGLATRQRAREFLQELLGLSLVTNKSNDGRQPTLVQNLPKQANNLRLNKSSKILESSRIVLSPKRIMYYACMVLNLESLQPAYDLNQTNTGQTPAYPLHQEVLTDFFQKNTHFWASRSSQTKTKTRKGLQQGWHVSSIKSEANFEAFWQVYSTTAGRQSFTTHSRDYFWEFFKREFSRILVARDPHGKAQGVWLGFSDDNSLIYMYGGNTSDGLDKFAPHIIQLAALQMACLEGKTWYDLGGWAEGTGYGFFKEGYKGELRHFPGGIDLILNQPMYKLVNILIKVSKTIKRRKTEI